MVHKYRIENFASDSAKNHLLLITSGGEIISDFDPLKDSRIYIYGAGGAGSELKNELETESEQLRVVAFLDSFKPGRHEGIKTIKLDDYIHQPGNMVIIASSSCREISNKLVRRNINDFMIDPPYDYLPGEKKMDKKSYEEKNLHPHDISKLKNLKIYLYGAGRAGKSFKQLVEENYEDIAIEGFIDSFKSGVFEGLKIIKFDDYEHHEKNMIIVTSCFQKDIFDALTQRGIKDFFISDSFWMFTFMFNPSEFKEKKVSANKISSILFSKRDKELFNFLFQARSYNSNLSKMQYLEESDTTVMALSDPAGFQEKFTEQTGKQYLDFVKTDSIRTVVQAGVYDGADILEINALSPELKTVYGFEPSGMKYILPELHDLIKKKKVIIEPYALFNQKTFINFFPAQAGSYISETMTPVKNTGTVETISLDEYCEKNNIRQIDFICCDIEDAEIQFLLGAEKLIRKSRPQLAISMYHSKDQFIEIPLLLNSMLENYIFRIGHYSNTLNETTIYAIPEEIG